MSSWELDMDGSYLSLENFIIEFNRKINIVSHDVSEVIYWDNCFKTTSIVVSGDFSDTEFSDAKFSDAKFSDAKFSDTKFSDNYIFRRSKSNFPKSW